MRLFLHIFTLPEKGEVAAVERATVNNPIRLYIKWPCSSTGGGCGRVEATEADNDADI